MAASLDLRPLTGPIRMSVVSEASVILRLAVGPIGIRVLGQPGPQGVTGPQGDKGDQGEPGITILPTDAPINGGFF
jgi:hypothetical protein